MKVSSYQETEPVEELPGVLKREVINAADGAPNFCMRVFDVKAGSSTPAHSHQWEHEVFVLAGRGIVATERGEIPIGKDDVIFVMPDEPHCFFNTGSETLRFICVIPLHK